MNTDPVKVSFKDGFVGEMITPSGTINLGKQENGMMPYHLLYGSLASCYYSNLLSISKKMKLTMDEVTIDVSGIKRDEVPTTLETVEMNVVIVNPSDENKFNKASQLAEKYCSVHETISKVAKITLNLQFQKDS